MSNLKTLRAYCKEEKLQAQQLYESSENSDARYNAEQAIQAWDELQETLHRHKDITPARFEKKKKTALRILRFMKPCQYRDQIAEKIKQLNLQT